MSEQQRLSVQEVSPAAIEAVLGMERFVRSTEAVTRLPVAGVPDPVWEAAATQFSESEMVQLLRP